MATRSTIFNGEYDRYRYTNKITPTLAPTIEPATPPDTVTAETLATKIQPAPYVGERFEIDLGLPKYGPNPDIDDPTPIYCMRSWPPGVMYIQAAVCRPNKAAIAETEARFPNMEKLLLELTERDGSKVDVLVDDGEIIAVKKKPNWLPLALAAGAAYFFMM